MELPKISIIVPIYKSEEYLETSISHLRDQDYPNLEIILVDDGSPDMSGIICDKYAAIDNRVIVVHKTNGGASDARNAGLDMATGVYICFADSDDIVETSYVSQMYHDLCSNESTDLVIQGFIQRWEDRERVFKSYSGIYNLKGGEIEHLFADIYINDYSGPYCKLFRKSILDEKQIRFSTKIIYAEDFDFLLRYIPHVRYIVLSNTTNYVYLMHSNSVSSKIYSFEKELSGMEHLSSAFDQLNSICDTKEFKLSRDASLSAYLMRVMTSNYCNGYSYNVRIHNLNSVDTSFIINYLKDKTENSLMIRLIYFLMYYKSFKILDFILYLRLVICK